jgi:hypothetical protein
MCTGAHLAPEIEEQTGEKEADLAAEFVGAVEAVALRTEHFETEFTKSQ